MKIIYKTYAMIKSRRTFIIYSIIMMLGIAFVPIFNFNNEKVLLLIQLMLMILGVVIIFITGYFEVVNKKSNEIYNLNKELENKINELKKIKHDYGSQISYLYGTYLMNNYDKLGKLLKDIMDNQGVSTQIKSLNNQSSIIAKVVNSSEFKDVDILIEEGAKLENTNVDYIDLEKIIYNILKKSIVVLEKRKIIIVKTFYDYNNVVVDVRSYGQDIDIYATREVFNKELSIDESYNNCNTSIQTIIELVDKYNGDINIISNKGFAQFIIKLPLIIK